MHKSTQNSPVPSTINKTVSLHFKNRSLWRRDMEFVKYFQKQTDRLYRCTIPVKKIDDNDVEHEQGCVRQVLGMQRNFKCERAWSDFTGAGWNCRWAGSGIERSCLLRLWAVERTPTWAGSGNSHRSAPLTCSGVHERVWNTYNYVAYSDHLYWALVFI